MSAFSQQLGEILPSVNAGLNSLSAICLLAGRYFIAHKQITAHRRAMLSACVVSALFLVCYLIRVVLTGTHRFPGEGLWRAVYLVILSTHMLLAVVVPVLALRAVQLAWQSRIEAHRRIVRYAYPIWLYVSVTGVIVYAMLYHFPH
jgi:putative membrane protein